MSVLPGLTLDGTNTKENVAKFLAGGLFINDEGWLIGPGLIHAPVLPEAETQAKITPVGTIYHTNGGNSYTKWESLINFWRRKDVTGEAHFQVDYTVAVQAIPVGRKADCNYRGNFFYKKGKPVGYISFESADNGPVSLPFTPWNEFQLNFIINSTFLFCVVYRMPCSACTSWDSGGIGYHSQFPEWSIYKGKTCPGAARIRQMDFIRHEVAIRLAEYYRQCGGSCPGV